MRMCILSKGKTVFTQQLNPRRKFPTLQFMKLFSWIFLSFILSGGIEMLRGQTMVDSAQADTAAPALQAKLPPPTPYAVVGKDANSKVWERTVYELGPDGRSVPKKHHYAELATGLNYLSNGRWTDSKEEIVIQPDGTAAATQGQHQAYFPG